jgi:transcription-repair coupling factor (superfamily II helicase)
LLALRDLIFDKTNNQMTPLKRGDEVSWSGLKGSADMLAVTELAANSENLTVVVTADSSATERWADGINFFSGQAAGQSNLNFLRFPDWETLPYDAFSPHQDIISERLASLSALKSRTRGVLIVPMSTLLQRVAPTSYLGAACFDLVCGQTFNVTQERLILESAGYQSAEIVVERGQYAVRGALIDIFPMGSKLPVRIDLFDDEIDTLRTFDPETQRTVEQITQLNLLPAKEFPFDDAAIARFRDRWHTTFNVDVRRCSVYQDVSSYIAPSGIEYYLPLFFEKLDTLFDYLPNDTTFVMEPGAMAAAESYITEVNGRYESLRYDIERPILEPRTLFLELEELQQHLNKGKRIFLQASASKHSVEFSTDELPDLHINARLAQPGHALQQFLEDRNRSVLFVAETAGRREIFDELLRKSAVQTRAVESFEDYLSGAAHCITVASLSQGLFIPNAIVVTENEVLGKRPSEGKKEVSRKILDPEQIVRNLTELSMGSPVVHVEHGVGRYLGLETLAIDNATYEFLMLGYAGGAKLYVPVTSMHLIGRYAGADEEHAPLHRLGSDQWERAKRKAAEKVIDVAAELLDIYARRELRKSHSLKSIESEYATFAEEFPFETTLDQKTAIEETLSDMAMERAMDRLVCGDVGFGKTEVAMRAAFTAVQSGKQVVMLVPTTLLAQQHYDTLIDRFANWPTTIDVASRTKTSQEIEEIAVKTANGKMDILIGTHKLLSPQFKFNDLGLVIVDEEHRFGVRQKERLRAIRAEVDVLTLTATPIPRTLNMSLSGIRDLSVIATPPAKRLSIKTFVQQRSEQKVREAISRELMRGGQVFFLHNEVRSIEQAAETIRDLVPEARVGIGHGQLRKNELEEVMSEFYHRRLNVLVCSTIIETGIDIPNANTIIIERADKFGLAQLHQLRGRVGRSHRQAYAYLLTPEPRSMTADAVKRLEAIEASGDLGIGFTLATQDMEIRGAGELLGDDQSGQIESIGFSMYMDMLNRAVNALRSGQIPDRDLPLEPVSQEINLHVPTLIPDDYLPDVQTRLILYKRISAAITKDDLDALQVEIIDRFGLLPPALKNLFQVTGLKLVAQSLGIIKVDLGEQTGKLEFSKTTKVDPMEVVKLVQQESHTYKLDGASTLRIEKELIQFTQRVEFALELFDRLAPDIAAAA